MPPISPSTWRLPVAVAVRLLLEPGSSTVPNNLRSPPPAESETAPVPESSIGPMKRIPAAELAIVDPPKRSRLPDAPITPAACTLASVTSPWELMATEARSPAPPILPADTLPKPLVSVRVLGVPAGLSTVLSLMSPPSAWVFSVTSADRLTGEANWMEPAVMLAPVLTKPAPRCMKFPERPMAPVPRVVWLLPSKTMLSALTVALLAMLIVEPLANKSPLRAIGPFSSKSLPWVDSEVAVIACSEMLPVCNPLKVKSASGLEEPIAPETVILVPKPATMRLLLSALRPSMVPAIWMELLTKEKLAPVTGSLSRRIVGASSTTAPWRVIAPPLALNPGKPEEIALAKISPRKVILLAVREISPPAAPLREVVILLDSMALAERLTPKGALTGASNRKVPVLGAILCSLSATTAEDMVTPALGPRIIEPSRLVAPTNPVAVMVPVPEVRVMESAPGVAPFRAP